MPMMALILALTLFVMSTAGSDSGTDTSRKAKEVAANIEKRLEILDGYIEKIQSADGRETILEQGLPEDMVIYQYENDSLIAWYNHFSILNDDISSRHLFYRLTDGRSSLVSPLSEATEEIAYMNIGPKWYLVKETEGNGIRNIIAGLEIKNSLIDDARRNENGVNPRLHLQGFYSVLPLNNNGGSAVELDGKPLFKIIYDSNIASPFFNSSILRWLSLLLFVFATVMFMAGHRRLKVYATVVPSLTVLFAVAFIWAAQMSGSVELFSPTIYADGPVLFSLGALLLINTYITLINTCSFFVRNRVYALAKKRWKHTRLSLAIYGFLTVMITVATAIYTHYTLHSLLLNSNISLELYRWNPNIPYTILVYLSYTGLLFCLLLQMQCLRPVIKELTGLKYDMLAYRTLILFAVGCSAYFTATSSYLGFEKEKDRIPVWANRLSVDRDLSLEIRLRMIEESICRDRLISAMTVLNNPNVMIQNRISDHYLTRVRQPYNIDVRVFNEGDAGGDLQFNIITRTGIPIAPNSHFFFIPDSSGKDRYVGLFIFHHHSRTTRMVLTIEPNVHREDRGYYNILGLFAKPGDITIPSFYSYAKYKEGRLVLYKGTYPYPTYYDFSDNLYLQKERKGITRNNDYVHFLNLVNDDELIVISRPKRGVMVYFTSFSYLCLALSGILCLFARSRGKKRPFKSNYFRTRINSLLFVSSFLILVSLTAISILFVYKRNADNLNNLMSSKIITMQALLQKQARSAQEWHQLNTQEFVSALENISNTTKCDITLYTPGGKVFRSTTPEIFEKMIMGSRINEVAYHKIKNLHQRFYIHRQKIGEFQYWALYAPIFNEDGNLMAIVETPYTDRSFDFRREAFFHAALIINIFLLLLIGSLFFSTREVNSLFAPLIEIGKKMNVADIHELEYIIYKREDEISSLVDAYNRMMKALSESTVQLAQAERDKAWSQMARQVAHEIKNPLTPIKLQIQRLIRLKENNNPAWEERFDEVTAIVLEHIEILSETANEFSTFAKLYIEEPVLFDLDKVLKEQITIFDNRENIVISYLGMENSMIMGPKPQLIRVFVNLINNAVQAVEIAQKEGLEAGEKEKIGRVFISLRNSMKEGCYDIAFEDNGAGVSEENQSKLFTPNFTTKSSGTGLGLAICRNIVEKCDGEIHYQKSLLGGAAFIVTIPKSTASQS